VFAARGSRVLGAREMLFKQGAPKFFVGGMLHYIVVLRNQEAMSGKRAFI